MAINLSSLIKTNTFSSADLIKENPVSNISSPTQQPQSIFHRAENFILNKAAQAPLIRAVANVSANPSQPIQSIVKAFQRPEKQVAENVQVNTLAKDNPNILPILQSGGISGELLREQLRNADMDTYQRLIHQGAPRDQALRGAINVGIGKKSYNFALGFAEGEGAVAGSIASKIAKSKNVQEIQSLLIKSGQVAREDIESLAKRLRPVTNPEEVRSIINAQKLIRQTPPVERDGIQQEAPRLSQRSEQDLAQRIENPRIFEQTNELRKAESTAPEIRTPRNVPPAIPNTLYPRSEPINLNRLQLSDTEKQNLQQVINALRPDLENLRGPKLTNEDIVSAARESTILQSALTRTQAENLSASLLRTRQHLTALSQEKGVSEEFIKALKTVSQTSTNVARVLQSLKIEASPELADTKEQLIKKLLKLGIDTKDIVRAGEGIDFTDARQAQRFYRKFVKPKVGEIVDEYRYINLLSSPKTHIVNAFSNALQASIVAPSTKLVSGALDVVASALTRKERQYYIREVPAYYRGVLNSIGDAVLGFSKVMRGEQLLLRPDLARIPTGNKFLLPFQVVPRLMEASDVLFRTLVTGGEIESSVYKARRRGRNIDEVTRLSFAQKAEEKASYYVFRKPLDVENKSGQGNLLSAIDRLTQGVHQLRKVPGVKWFVPFVETPMNILKQGIEYSPLGAATLKGSTHKTEQLAKTMIGSTVFLGAGYLALSGRTTWSAPTTAKDKEAFFASGRQAYAIKIGNNWIAYSRIGPLAYPLAMAAAVQWYYRENPESVTQSQLEKFSKVLAGIGSFFSSQSYLEGIGTLVEAISGEARGAALVKSVTQVPSQLVPLAALDRWVATMIDPVFRKPDKHLSVQAIVQQLEAGIPVFSKNVEPYTNPAGDVSRRPHPVANAFSPLARSTENQQFEHLYQTRQESARARSFTREEETVLDNNAKQTLLQLNSMNREDAAKEFDRIIQENPTLAQKINNLAQGGVTAEEKSIIQHLGIKNSERARFIYDHLQKLPTQEEKANYYQYLLDNNLVNEEVDGQIGAIIQRNQK